MKPPDGTMRYEAEGYAYWLLPTWTGKGALCRVVAASMWNMDDQYIGVWHRTQMPLKLIWQLQSWCKYLMMFGWTSNGEETFGPEEQ